MDLRKRALPASVLASLACFASFAWAGARVENAAQRPASAMGDSPHWELADVRAAAGAVAERWDPATGPSDPVACGLSPEAQALAALVMEHPLQARPRLRCSALLSRVAASKAREMAELGRVSHGLGVTPPNRRLRLAGYALPRWYPRVMSNQVESIAGGFDSPHSVLSAWMDSPPHRAHLMADHALYLEQDEIGVGFHYAPRSEHGEYWVVYIARRDGGPELPRGLWADKGEAGPDKR